MQDPFAQYAVAAQPKSDPFAEFAVKTTEPPAPEGSALSRFASNAADVLNPLSMVSGAYNAVRHPIDTYNGLVDASAEQFRKAADAPTFYEKAGHFAAGVLPGIGPAAANAGEQIASGDIAGGLGRGVALAATPMLAEGAVRTAAPILKRGSLRLMQGSLKPTETLVKARAGAGFASKQAVAQAVLDEGRIVTPGSLGKAQDALEQTDAAANAAIKNGAGAGVTVDPFKVTEAIDAQAANGFGKQINAAPDVNAIQSVHDAFASNPYVSDPVTGMAPMPADLAHDFSVNTGKNLRGKFGRLGGATVEAEKAGRASITGQLRMKIPELEPLWQQEARQITTRDALEQALARTGNRDPIGLTGIVGAVKSPALALTALADKWPVGKSMLANGLYRAPTSGAALAAAVRAAIMARLNPSEDTQGR